MNYIKITLIHLLLFTHGIIFGQEPKSGEIEVLGVGKLTANADLATLIISVSAASEDRGSVVKELNDKSEVIRKDLIDYGFKHDQITLTNFEVEDNHQYAEPPTERKRFEGHRLFKVKFKFDYDFNVKVTDKLATHSFKPYFKFEFELSEEKKESVRKILIEKALADARTKAEIIANAYNLKLNRIITITCGEHAYTPNVEVYSVDLGTEIYRPTISTVPDSPSIEYGETIVVTWGFDEVNVR